MLENEKLLQVTDFLENELELDNIVLPDEYFYPSLPLCLLDAVFSIGVKYASTRNTVQRYCSQYGLPLDSRSQTTECKEHTISELIQNIETVGTEKFAEEILQNKQHTSSKNGILKVQAVLECAKILQKYGLDTLEDFRKKWTSEVESEFLNVRGQGSGISLTYLKMLCGGENSLKPDRHIIRFLEIHSGETFDVDSAKDAMQNILNVLVKDHPSLNMRKLDFCIWDYQRNI